MSNINEAIDTAISAISNIKTDGSISKADVRSEIGNAKSALNKAIRNNTVDECRNADGYFQQKIGSIRNEFLTIPTPFKKLLANKKERKIRAKKLNYKKLTKDTFKTESGKVADALKDVNQSGGIANVEKINVILRESVRDVVIKLGNIR
jgi:Skp family chaperone for outer membrane proteins